MLFNVENCKIMHKKASFEYEMTGKGGNTKVLKSVEMEKYLGVNVQDNLKFDNPISLTINRAKMLVEFIKTAFSFIDEEREV